MERNKRKIDDKGNHDQEAPSKKPQSLPVLHSYFRSSCSWRVRTVLALKKIKYEYVAVHLVKNEQNNEDYIKLNPNREVPALLIDGHVLTQSVAIMEYLEETRPDNEFLLLPKDPVDRAKVRQIVQLICSDTQPIQNLRVLNYVGEKKTSGQNIGLTGILPD